MNINPVEAELKTTQDRLERLQTKVKTMITTMPPDTTEEDFQIIKNNYRFLDDLNCSFNITIKEDCQSDIETVNLKVEDRETEYYIRGFQVPKWLSWLPYVVKKDK